VRIETRVDPYGDEDVPKTKAGLRTVPLGEGVLLSLRAWRLRSAFSVPEQLGRLHEPRRHGETEIPSLIRPVGRVLEGAAAQRANREIHLAYAAAFCDFVLDRCGPSAQDRADLRRSQQPAGHYIYGHLFRSDNHGHVMDAIANENV
jgi:integrase